MMQDPKAKFATPRLASGALFVDCGKVFLVSKTYGNRWDIPGGYVDHGESPAAACEREIHEELGIERTVQRLLIHDWAPNDVEGDKILYIFDCGKLGDDERRVRVDSIEVDEVKWVSIGNIADFVIPRLALRVTNAYRAYESDTILYLEHGRPRTQG